MRKRQHRLLGGPAASTGRRPKPVALDLFSGCGGLTLGLKRAGFRVVGAVDIDPLAMETYKKNHPDVKRWRLDVQQLPVSIIRKRLKLKPGELDLLAGCPPCQGFSVLRTLQGARVIRDKRNDLVFEFLRFVRQLRPKAVMMENVPRLAKNGRLKIFRRELRSLGYESQVRILNAADYGVPQRRRRMILLAGLREHPSFATKARVRRTVQDAIGHLVGTPKKSRDPLHSLPETHAPHVAEIIRSIPKGGGSRSDLGVDRQLDCHKRCEGFKDIYGRMAWDKVSPTITGGCVNPSKGRFLHPRQNRAITLREAALLQTFPGRYFFSLRRGKYPAAQMIGNALPPEFIRRQALQVSAFLRESELVSSLGIRSSDRTRW